MYNKALPKDIFFLILSFLPPSAIIHLSRTNKQVYDWIQNWPKQQHSEYWKQQLQNHFPKTFKKLANSSRKIIDYRFEYLNGWQEEKVYLINTFSPKEAKEVRLKEAQDFLYLLLLIKEENINKISQSSIKKSHLMKQDSQGYSLIKWAIKIGNQAILDELYQKVCQEGFYADPWNMTMTQLHWAILCHQSVKDIEDLVAKGADVKAAAGYIQTQPIHVAVENGYFEVVQVLIKHGADVKAVAADGKTPLHVAAQYGHFEVVKVLLEHGADVKAVATDGKKLLHVAAQYGHLEVVEFLIQCEADVKAATSYGETPLHLAAENGNLEAVEFLIQHGADVKAAASYGETPPHLAAENGHFEVVQVLIKHGADVKAVAVTGRTPLHLAARYGCLNVVEFLIQCGADVKAATRYEETPLHLAAENGHLEAVEFLIQCGADVKAVTRDGETPLRLAAKNGHFEVVRNLIQHGSDIRDEDIDKLYEAANSIDNSSFVPTVNKNIIRDHEANFLQFCARLYKRAGGSFFETSHIFSKNHLLNEVIQILQKRAKNTSYDPSGKTLQLIQLLLRDTQKSLENEPKQDLRGPRSNP